MKKVLLPLTLISLAIGHFPLLAEDKDKDKDNDNEQKTSETKPQSVEEAAEAQPDATLTDCLDLSNKKMRWTQVARTTQSNAVDGVELWIDLINKNAQESKEYKEAKDQQAQEEALKNFKSNEGTKYLNCIGYSFIMAAREEGFESGRVKKSGDGRVKCYNHGYHTMDYEACGKLVDAYDMASVAQVGLQAFQMIDFQNTTSDASKEYMQNTTNPTSALEAQKKSVKKQADIANTQAAFHAAKVAAMWTLYDKMPNEETLTENCKTFLTADAMNAIKEAGISGNQNLETLCSESAAGQVNFLGNSSAKDDIKRIMAEETMNAVAKTAQGALLNKQARKINSAIDQVNAFDPSAVVSVPETPDLCLSNPNDASCKLADTRTDVDLAGNGFTVSGDWGGTNASTSNRSDEDQGSSSSTPSTKDVGVSAIGKPLEDNSTSGGFASAAPAAGTVEAGGSNTGGGGGGGSAGAVGLPSGGGGGGSGQGGASGEEKASTKLAYTGGEGGARYAGAATGKKTSDGKDGKNPFDDLFGKKKGTDGNGVLNFRDPASSEIGDKDGRSLFEMISNRYRVSQEKKRLIEYEAVEK